MTHASTTGFLDGVKIGVVCDIHSVLYDNAGFILVL